MTAWMSVSRQQQRKEGRALSALALGGCVAFAVLGCVDDSEPAGASASSGSASVAGTGGLFGGNPTEPNPEGGDTASGDQPSTAGSRCGAVPPGGEPRIDNFEDGDTTPIVEAGRLGAWHLPPLSGEQTLSFEVEPEGADGTDFAVHISIAGFDDRVSVGASLRFDQDNVSCPYNVSEYSAVAFYAKGTGTIELLLDSTDTWSSEFGGTCDTETQVCWDLHRKLVPLTTDWKYYEARWDSFSQAGWGEISPFVPQHFLGIEFAVSPDALPAELWLDEVRFVSP